jgi:hypothetical protein
MEIASPLPTGAPTHVRLSRSPAFHWERRRAATAAAPLRRRQGSTSARRAPLRPTFSPHPAGRARPVPPRWRPRRRWERAGADGRSPSGPGRDLCVKVFDFSGTRAQKTKNPPPSGSIISCVCVAALQNS